MIRFFASRLKLLTEHYLEFLRLKLAEKARLSLHLCNMYGVYVSYFVYLVSVDPDIGEIDGK